MPWPAARQQPAFGRLEFVSGADVDEDKIVSMSDERNVGLQADHRSFPSGPEMPRFNCEGGASCAIKLPGTIISPSLKTLTSKVP